MFEGKDQFLKSHLKPPVLFSIFPLFLRSSGGYLA